MRCNIINAIDGLFNTISGFLEKVAGWIPSVEFPWEKLTEKWGFITGYIKQANVFFPLDTLMTISGLVVSFLGLMMVLWGIKFMKEMIPFI